MIERILKNALSEKLFKGKTLVVIGAKQVVKTTLIKEVLRGKNKENFQEFVELEK
ncbi:MAG TPA: hypothetical protein VFM65_05745 [Flavobacteriaceae bacterium]|nr:hypothetical protein [Flavobacteriaceae bacterium]